ncbi:MAG: homocysteine S-methyltransferase family protein [Armatimonadetes bacterium]|nr:homocysteine S-methyltransferase family protein [Armatimonadota bacterium]
MKSLLERLAAGEILISDGAMGTFLQAKGLAPGESPEAWCVSHPDAVKSVTEAYIAAGSDIIETNSLGGTSYKQKEFGLEDKVIEFNIAAAKLAREAMGDKGCVAASVGPTGQIIEDEGGMASPEALYDAFKEQAMALEEGGADAVCIETMSSVAEAVQAIKAAKENTKLTIIATFTFEPGARGFRTMMGVTPKAAALASVEAGADIVGANCGSGIDNMIEITRQIRAAVPNTPIMIQANAGAPVLENGKTVFKDTPQDMAAKVQELIAAGANIIGGCCGTTPEHIRAIAEAAKGNKGGGECCCCGCK